MITWMVLVIKDQMANQLPSRRVTGKMMKAALDEKE